MAIQIEQTPEQILAAKKAAEVANKDSQFTGANPYTGERYIIGDLSLNPQYNPANASRYTTPTESPYAKGGAFGVQKPYTPEEEQALRDAETKKVQAQIDAINVLTEQELSKARARATQASGSNRARLSATGQLGAGSETTTTDALAEKASEERKAIEAERTLRVSQIYKDVDKTTSDLIKARKEEAITNTEKYLADLKDKSTTSLSRVTELAKLGVEIAPEYKKQLIEQSGLDATTFDNYYNALKVANIPKTEVVGDPVKVGSKLIYTVRDAKSPNGLKNITLDTGVDLESGDYTITSDNNGVWVIDKNTGTAKKVGEANIPAKSAAERKAEQDLMKEEKQTEYSLERADRVISQVDDALKDVDRWTTGIGGAILRKVPETSAFNFDKKVEAIKANIGFNELQAMRAASPTGGALGQVAVQELNFLQSVLGSLDTAQSPSQIKENLKNIKIHFTNWKNAVEQSRRQGGSNIGSTEVLRSPDGKSQVNISDLTPAQIEEAKNAGWK